MAGRLVRGWARTPVELRVAAVVAGFVASSVLPQPCGALVCRHEAGWAHHGLGDREAVEDGDRLGRELGGAEVPPLRRRREGLPLRRPRCHRLEGHSPATVRRRRHRFSSGPIGSVYGGLTAHAPHLVPSPCDSGLGTPAPPSHTGKGAHTRYLVSNRWCGVSRSGETACG